MGGFRPACTSTPVDPQSMAASPAFGARSGGVRRDVVAGASPVGARDHQCVLRPGRKPRHGRSLPHARRSIDNPHAFRTSRSRLGHLTCVTTDGQPRPPIRNGTTAQRRSRLTTTCLPQTERRRRRARVAYPTFFHRTGPSRRTRRIDGQAHIRPRKRVGPTTSSRVRCRYSNSRKKRAGLRSSVARPGVRDKIVRSFRRFHSTFGKLPRSTR